LNALRGGSRASCLLRSPHHPQSMSDTQHTPRLRCDIVPPWIPVGAR
jgi:hypothetical protein